MSSKNFGIDFMAGSRGSYEVPKNGIKSAEVNGVSFDEAVDFDIEKFSALLEQLENFGKAGSMMVVPPKFKVELIKTPMQSRDSPTNSTPISDMLDAFRYATTTTGVTGPSSIQMAYNMASSSGMTFNEAMVKLQRAVGDLVTKPNPEPVPAIEEEILIEDLPIEYCGVCPVQFDSVIDMKCFSQWNLVRPLPETREALEIPEPDGGELGLVYGGELINWNNSSLTQDIYEYRYMPYINPIESPNPPDTILWAVNRGAPRT